MLTSPDTVHCDGSRRDVMAIMVSQVVTRTCIGCRQRAPIAELVRVAVVIDNESTRPRRVVPDAARKLPGRGAWLHPERACLVQAERRRAFGRALRESGQLDIELVRDYYQGR